jgi:hypothetical protein
MFFSLKNFLILRALLRLNPLCLDAVLVHSVFPPAFADLPIFQKYDFAKKREKPIARKYERRIKTVNLKYI